MATSKNITAGEVFGRLTIISEAKKLPNSPHRRVTAQCKCGTLKDYIMSAVRRGHVTSCGCFYIEQKSKHGHAKAESATYASWSAMKSRCSKLRGKKEYAGKGIKVCERWEKFENFLADMGERPEGMTVDRWPNQTGDYEPNNCRWATASQQANNRKTCRIVSAFGKKLTMMEWSVITEIPFQTIRHRLLRGWSEERSVSQ
jgi:hypothetical protein